MNKSIRGSRLTESQVGFLLVLPAMAIFGFIILYPFINSLLMSVTDKSMTEPTTSFIGLENFIRIFSGPDFLKILNNTFIFVIFGTLAPMLFGFLWAILLNQGFRGSELLRGITLINWIIPSTAIGFLWMWIFHGQFGLFNELLMKLGWINSKVTWLGQTQTAMMVIIVAKTWQTLPWFMAFFLGGLQSVSKEQIEAARIDGANNWRVLTNVILPEIKGIVYLVAILGAIGSLQHFDLIYVMTEGGPAKATTTFAIEVYNKAFKAWNLGLASAYGAIWVLILGIFGFFYLRSVREETQ